MEKHFKAIVCDGCGFPASPEHIAERLARLELATRFRPIHMHLLFIALGPSARPEDDFYGPPRVKDFFEPFMESLGISASLEKSASAADGTAQDVAQLVEFQRRGFYLSYLSECPLPARNEEESAVISTLAPTLIRRIRLNYKPEKIALLGKDTAQLIAILENAGLGPLLLLDHGNPLTVPEPGNPVARPVFQDMLSSPGTS